MFIRVATRRCRPAFQIQFLERRRLTSYATHRKGKLLKEHTVTYSAVKPRRATGGVR